MKKLAKQFLALMFVLILALGVFPQKAEAYTDHYIYHASSIKAGSSFTAKAAVSGWRDKNFYDYDYHYYMYKFTVPENSYLKITTSNASNYLHIYTKYAKGYISKSSDYCISTMGQRNTGKKTFYRVLPAGTYYLNNYGSSNSTVTLSTVKCKLPTNYCKNRATVLKTNNKAVTVLNSNGNEFSRWFKVKATSSKFTITQKVLDFEGTTSYGRYDLRDSSGKRIEYSSRNYQENKATVSETFTGLKKGKYYYICLGPDSGNFSDKYSQERLITLSVK